jgi:hypothetical protein
MEFAWLQIPEQQEAISLETKTARRSTTLLPTSTVVVLEPPLIAITSQVS